MYTELVVLEFSFLFSNNDNNKYAYAGTTE
jgi:hypothetical protein